MMNRPVSWSIASHVEKPRKSSLYRDSGAYPLGVFGVGAHRRDVHVLAVRRDEAPAVRGLQVRHVEDLLGLEVAQIDHRDPAVRPVVDVEVPTVVRALGLRERRVVGVAPGERVRLRRVRALAQHDVALVGAVAVALPRVRREHRDHLRAGASTARRSTHDLAGVPARRHHEVLVVLAARHVGLQRGLRRGAVEAHLGRGAGEVAAARRAEADLGSHHADGRAAHHHAERRATRNDRAVLGDDRPLRRLLGLRCALLAARVHPIAIRTHEAPPFGLPVL